MLISKSDVREDVIKSEQQCVMIGHDHMANVAKPLEESGS